MDIKYELVRLDRNIRRLEKEAKLCREQIEQIRIRQEKNGPLQARAARMEKTGNMDVPREDRQPPL